MGEVLAKGGTVRVRPLDGGGNETQVEAPAEGRFYVKGLVNGNYEAVDELGNRRVFTVTQGTGEEVELEVFEALDAPAPAELPANYGTEAPLVADESHEIQHGLPAMRVDGATLTREGSERPSDLSPPSVPGPDNSAPGAPTPPSAEVVEETVGNSSDAEAEREPGDPVVVPTGDPSGVGAGTVPFPANPEEVAALEGGSDVPQPETVGTGNDTPTPGTVAAGSDVPPADDPEHEPEQ